jgi:hypothetical protein
MAARRAGPSTASAPSRPPAGIRARACTGTTSWTPSASRRARARMRPSSATAPSRGRSRWASTYRWTSSRTSARWSGPRRVHDLRAGLLLPAVRLPRSNATAPRGSPIPDPRSQPCGLHRLPDRPRVQRLARPRPREHVRPRTHARPVLPQLFEQHRRERHQPVPYCPCPAARAPRRGPQASGRSASQTVRRVRGSTLASLSDRFRMRMSCCMR